MPLAILTYSCCSAPNGVQVVRPDVPMLIVVHEEQTIPHSTVKLSYLQFKMQAIANLSFMQNELTWTNFFSFRIPQIKAGGLRWFRDPTVKLQKYKHWEKQQKCFISVECT